MELSESSLIGAPKCVLAIDPGLSGACALIGRGFFTVLRDFKVCPEIALAVRTLCQHSPDLAVIEAVHAFPGQGVCSVWSFAEATGYAKAALCLAAPPGTRAIEVPPQTWQKFFRLAYGLGKQAEFDSRALAIKLFPSYPQYFTRVKDHNSADAVLIGAWALLRGSGAEPRV